MTDAVSGQVRFTTDTGTFDVAIDTIKNAVAFERKFNVSASVLSVEPRVEWLAFMAFTAAQDKGIPVGRDFDRFVNSLTDIEAVEDSGEGSSPTDGEQ